MMIDIDDWDDLENECGHCEYYDVEEGMCSAFSCNPFDCDIPLPCEIDESGE